MMAVRNRVLLLLVTAGATAIGLLGFVTQSPNRLLSGRPVALWQAADPPMLALISVIAVALLVAASLKPSRPVHVAALVLAGALVTLLAVAAGNFAATQVSADGLGRVAPGGGLWIAAFCAAMAMVDALQRLAAPPPLRALVLAAMAALFTALTLAGVFDALSFAREFRSHRNSFVAEFARHMTLVLGSVAPALLIGIPLGIAALRSRRLRDPLFAALNLLQTIPSVALFALLIGPLALLAAAVPFLAAHGVHGIGVTPALIALTLYALLPIARYTFAGLDAVDAAVVEIGPRHGHDAGSVVPARRGAAGGADPDRRIAGGDGARHRPGRGRRADRRRGAGQFRLSGHRPGRRRSGVARRDPDHRAGAGRRFPAAGGRRPAAPAGGAMIQIERVVKEFDGRRVIDDLSLAVPQGELCVLIGASGSGKSTALRLVNRLVAADAGTIRVNGADVATVPVERLRRGIGYVIQSVGLFPHWSVEDNIATVPRLLGWPEARVRDRVAALLDLLRLDAEIAKRRPHQLSGGQAQRVGVARALAADPAILLMDEPFGALDPITRSALQDELANIHRATGKTILFVTHDIDEALKLAGRIAVIDRGRIVQVGTPRQVLEAPAEPLVAALIGEDGLRLLAVRTAADAARPLDGQAVPEGEPLDGAAPLRAALSAMLARRTDRIAVKGADGRVTGTIALGDIVRNGR